jgi:hypothetical protein
MRVLRRSGLNPAPGLRDLQRLGKNIDGYSGETIDITALLADCVTAGQAHGWTVEEIPVTAQLNLPAFIRKARGRAEQATGDPRPAAPTGAAASATGNHRPGVYISAGIHGDEPAGPLAVRQLLLQNRWPTHLDLWLCPCLNPTGFPINRRQNAQGIDLNRQYLQPTAPETLAHISWLGHQPPFGLCLCLHEDWEADGFYVYELNPEDHRSDRHQGVGSLPDRPLRSNRRPPSAKRNHSAAH